MRQPTSSYLGIVVVKEKSVFETQTREKSVLMTQTKAKSVLMTDNLHPSSFLAQSSPTML